MTLQVHPVATPPGTMSLARIISGGQTGVDRGALDASLDAGFPCGGWCPPGRTAEDGPIPPRYPLTEMATGGYRERTLQNVRDSDGTLVIFFGRVHGGTAQTVQNCIREQKPYRLVDAERVEAAVASRLAARFVTENRVAILNVAGPRASGNAAAYAFARNTIARLLQMSGMRK